MARRFRPTPAAGTAAARPPSRRLPLLLLALLVLTVVGIATAVFRHESGQLIEAEWRRLDSRASQKLQEIAAWRLERIQEAERLTENPRYQQAAQAILAGEPLDPDAWARFHEEVSVLVARSRYQGVFLLDSEGRVRRAFGAELGNAGELPAEFSATVGSGQPSVHAYFEPGTEGRVLRFHLLAPLIAQGRVLGALLFQIDPYQEINPVVSRWPAMGSSAEVLVVQAEGDRIAFLTPPRLRPGLETVTVSPGTRLVAAQARYKRGRITGVDYRGEPVLALARAIPDTPWLLLAKVDEEEVLAPVRKLALWSALLGLGFIGAGSGLLRLWWRKEQAGFLLARSEAERRREALVHHFELFARYANDIILLVDENGRIISANERAYELYGYSHETLPTLSMDQLRAPGEPERLHPIWDRLGTERAAVYETRHRTADGRILELESSVRLIEQQGRRLYSVILRDIAERKAAERRLHRLNQLYAMLSETEALLVRRVGAEELYANVCRIAVEQGPFLAAWVMLRDSGELLRPVACAGPSGFQAGFQEAQPPVAELEAVAWALRERRPRIINDLGAEQELGQWCGRMARQSAASAAVLPVLRRGSAIGALVVCASEAGIFDAELQSLLRRMVDDLAFGLDYLASEQQRQAVEQALRDSEARYRNLFESMNNTVLVLEVRDGERLVVVDANDAVECIYETTRDQILGHDLDQVFPGFKAAGVTEILWEVWRSGKPRRLPPWLYRDERVKGWRESYFYKLPSGQLVLLCQDVSDRVEAVDGLRRSQERLALVLEGTRDAYWDMNFETGQIYYSPRFAELLGYALEELEPGIGGWERLITPEDLPHVSRALEAHLAGETPMFISTHRMHRKNGSEIWVMARGRVVRRDAQQRPLRMAGTHTDITAQKQIEDQLRLLATVFEFSHDLILIADPERRVVSANRAFTQVTDYGVQEVQGRSLDEVLATGQDRAFQQALWAAVTVAGYWQGEVRNRRRDGQLFPLWLTLSTARDPAGHIEHYIAIGVDVSERKAAEERIRYLAYHDVLTGLPNRSLLQDRLELALSHARRAGKRVGVLFMDLDRFKTVNDSLSHQAGDALLRQLADRLRTCVRLDDTVCRFGGDEFVLLLWDLIDPGDAARVAQKVLEQVAEPFNIQNAELHLSASIGIALYPDDGTDGERLIRNADAAMYFAKESGRNNFQFFIQELNERALTRLNMENRLRRALERNEFRLCYQPQGDLASGRVVGAEALLRWQRDDETIEPHRFIPMAEETGLILPIGEWVWQEVCRQQRAWMDQGLPAVPVAVNMSAVQFRRRDLLTQLERVLGGACVAPGALEVELTEGIIMQEAESTIGTLNGLKAMGVKLAIDDFGTGYSSLNYLRRFPIDKLKVDQSFIHDLTVDPADRAITAAIIALGKSLGLKVIAEGVENDEELSFVRDRGCDEVQGFFYSPPLSADEFADWWRGHTGDGPM